MVRPRYLHIYTIAALILALAPTLSRASGSWPGYRGPGGRGASAETLPPGEGPLALELAWKRPLGSAYSGISVADGFLVTAAAYGNRDFVVALDPRTGEERWRYDLAPIYSGHDGSHDGVSSTPAIGDGRVFMLSPWGHLAALDLTTGEALWTKHLVDDLGSTKPFYGYGSSPLVIGQTMVLQIGGEDGSVAGFDVTTGEVRWRTFDDKIFSQSPILAEIDGRLQVVVLGFSKVAGLDPTDGTTLWELELEGRPDIMGAMTQSPIPLGDGRIFLKHTTGKTTFLDPGSNEVEATPAVTHTSRGLAKSYSPPALSGSEIYGFTARFLSAVDPGTGELLWRSREPGDGFLVAVGGQLAVLTKTGSLHLGAASRDGWQESARLDLFGDLAWTPPSFADGSFYVRSLGEIARVDLTRVETQLLTENELAIPSLLEGLVAEIEAADDTSAVVDRFLDGRELPLIDGEQVVFLWRGGEDVAIGGDMIGMRREERMHQLPGTDLWWWQTALDRRARMSYLFFSDYQPAVDPSHNRRVKTTVLGPDMNWQRDEPVEMSWFAMPDWPGEIEPVAVEPAPRSRLETVSLTVQPPAGEDGVVPEPVEVPISIWLPPDYEAGTDRFPVVYVHHEAARESGDWPRTLDRLVGRSVAPLIAIFPESPRGFSDMFVEQIVPQIDQRYRTQAERTSRANVAMGWSGFGTTAMTFENPDTFGALGVQSMYLLDEMMEIIENAVGKADASTVPTRIYLEWGRWDLFSPHEDMNMRVSSEWAWDFFSAKGWEPIGGEVWDSTDFASWRNRTGALLEALFPLAPSPGELPRWQTTTSRPTP